MSITITAAEAAAKHANNLKNSIEEIRRGVMAVTENPMEKAAAAKDKWVAGIRDSADKWAARVSAVSMEDWKSAMLNKGVNRIAEGVDAAIPKTTAFFDRLLPFEANLQARVNQMPDTSLEDSVNRASTWIREMAKFSG